MAAAVMLACAQNNEPAPLAPVSRDDPFLADLERRTFNWFWETANPANGLVPDRWPTPSFSSVAAVGFGLSAYPIGVERGWVTRAQAAERALTTLRFLYQAPQDSSAGATGYHGFFYHFLDMQTGSRYRTVELSTIDTSLLLGGVLLCREYFDGADATEGAVRAYADSIYRRVDWQWAVKNPPLVNMGWTPEQGFNVQWDWRGYDEAMILYVLALGSPTHPIDPAAWTAWTSSYKWGTFYGQAHVGFAPLFGHQYSHAWIDFRGIRDAYMRARGIDYFENSRRATLAQRQYAIANPGGWRDYGASTWGLTACDGPADTTVSAGGRTRQFHTYAARGATFDDVRDDGTIAPTAAGGSIPFAPEVAVPALKAMRDRYGDRLYTQYGFLDAFNPSFPAGATPKTGRVYPDIGWVDVDYLGIDQGPILLMIENFRTGLVWRYMKRSPYVRAGLQRAGFTGGWLAQ